jgi:hypothetical protein
MAGQASTPDQSSYVNLKTTLRPGTEGRKPFLPMSIMNAKMRRRRRRRFSVMGVYVIGVKVSQFSSIFLKCFRKCKEFRH